MNDFDEFWEKNKDKYIDIIKLQAMNDFQILNSQDLYIAHVYIDSDDDFTLDCGDSIGVSGKTKKEVEDNLVKALSSAKLTYINGNHAESWFYIRDNAIKNIKKGETSFSFGGNQTIEYYIVENKPSIDLEDGKKIIKNKLR